MRVSLTLHSYFGVSHNASLVLLLHKRHVLRKKEHVTIYTIKKKKAKLLRQAELDPYENTIFNSHSSYNLDNFLSLSLSYLVCKVRLTICFEGLLRRRNGIIRKVLGWSLVGSGHMLITPP